jgi:hypothetical protein
MMLLVKRDHLLAGWRMEMHAAVPDFGPVPRDAD